MAYSMVSYFGMSEKVGNISFYDSTGARGYEFTKPYSEKTAELLDSEVKRIVDEVTERTKKLLKENWDSLSVLAEKLITEEIIMSEDIQAVLGPKAGKHGSDRLEAEKKEEKKEEEAESFTTDTTANE